MTDGAAIPPRRVLVAGATGLVGRCLVQRLCSDPAVGVVHALLRRPLPWEHPKLQSHLVDFAALPALPPLDEVYLALGTTIKVAGSQQAFRAVDFDASLAVARAARTAGAQRLGLVSALGADARSAVFYSRVKGELEDALAAEPWSGLVMARPSMLRGDRSVLGQPQRPDELLWGRVDAFLGRCIPGRWRAISADDVAAALVRAVPGAQGKTVLSSAAMQGAAARAPGR